LGGSCKKATTIFWEGNMRVLFVCQTQGHDPRTVFEKPTGGCLTSLTRVSEELVKLGHEVFVSSTYAAEETVNGVQYIRPDGAIGKWDVTVFNRNVLPRDFVIYCKEQGTKVVWWLHDIVDPRYLPDDTFKYVDRIVAQSQYCKTTYKEFYGIADERFEVIPNGVEASVFNQGDYEKRNPNIYITASALIKGYMPLDLCYMNLKRHNPDLDFRIYSSQKLHGFQNSPAQQGWLNQMEQAGAHVYQPMSPRSLAAVMKKAWALLMPNSYPEMCSNLLLQARACGLPVVSSNIGSNPEWIKHEETGLLTERFHPHDIHSWTKEFTEQACRLYMDRALHKKLSQNAPKNIPTWEAIGREWNDALSKALSC
jgi:glycosyltransferase involved in cell wall biosynthesis